MPIGMAPHGDPDALVTISMREHRILNAGGIFMPTNDLTPGLKAEIVTTVDDKLVVRHMGGDGVLSTPSMIGLM